MNIDSRKEIIKWANAVLDNDNTLILDTETTGLKENDEIIQIAIINIDGNVLFDSLLKPMKLVHPEARMVNKITDDDLKQAPTFPEIYETISQYVKNRKILAYNSDFDRRMLRQTCQKYGLEKLYVKGWDCVMEKYGYFWGWRDGLNTYKPQSLVDACAQQKIQIFNAHNAKYDCLLTLKLIIAVASTKD